MPLNSLDIRNKNFNTRFRGYDRQEVDEFLEIVIRDYDEMTQKIKDNDRTIKSMQERLTDFDNMKDSLNRSILVAQDTADNVKAQAEANAERINRDASQRGDQILEATNREARQILQSTYDEARRLVNESDELKRGMRSYYQRITMLIEGQLANIKSSDWEETLKPSPIYVGDTEEKLREIIEHTNQNFFPINEKGEEIVREGEKAPETLESFAQALSSTPQASGASAEKTEEKAGTDFSINLGSNVNFNSN
ncbi:DivIVA domain-containing protein [Lactovum odontotermitis]